MARLTTKQRKAVPKSDFGVPSKAPGPGSYPMPDKAHARAAKSLAHNASPAERERIDAMADRKLGIKEGGAKDKKIDRLVGVPDHGPKKKKAAPKKTMTRRRKG